MDDAAINAFVDSAMGHSDTLATARRVAGARYAYLLHRQLRDKDKLALMPMIICEGDYLSATLGVDQGSRARDDAVHASLRTREDSELVKSVDKAAAMHTFGPSNAECDSINKLRRPVDTLVAYHQ